MQLDSSLATIPASTPERILPLDNTNTDYYETTNVSHILSSHEAQTDFEMEIDDHLPLTQSQKEDLIDTQSWADDIETTPATLSTNNPSNDIHLTSPEDEQQKILDFYEIKGFIRQLKTEFFFKLPIGPEWIKEGLIQSEKPHIPSNFSQVKEELEITSNKLNREHPEFTVTIKIIKEKYFGRIPKQWITLILPDLLNLEEAQTILKSESNTITLSIIEDGLLMNKLNALRKIFHFEKLPPEFLIEP
ncbi:6289_t:CDS:2, partial [Acaulospora colombiana]